MLLATADGIALLADGSVYVNSVGPGTLMRIPVKADGSAGAVTKLETSRPLQSPDGMRSVGSKTMLLVEGAGRLDEVTINGDKAEIKVLKEGLTGPTAVTMVGDMAFVAEARLNYRNDPKLREGSRPVSRRRDSVQSTQVGPPRDESHHAAAAAFNRGHQAEAISAWRSPNPD